MYIYIYTHTWSCLPSRQDSSFDAPMERSGLSPSVNKSISCLGENIGKKHGEMMVKQWANDGEMLVKQWWNDGQMVMK